MTITFSDNTIESGLGAPAAIPCKTKIVKSTSTVCS